MIITGDSAPNFHPRRENQNYGAVVWQIRTSLREYGVCVWVSLSNRQGLSIIKSYLKRGKYAFFDRFLIDLVERTRLSLRGLKDSKYATSM